MSADVALDVRTTSHMSAGMLLYVRELARLAPQLAPDLRFAAVGSGDNFGLAEQAGLPLALLRLRPRLVHFPSPFVPLWLPRRFVVTIHDLIELQFPQFSKPHAVWYYRRVIRRVARAAAIVITDDERTRDALAREYDLDAARIRVIALGTDARFDVPRAPSPRRYVFYAGNHRPHKDLLTLFRAWHALPRGTACDLHITGSDDFNGLLAEFAREDARIVPLGQIADEELPAVYAGAAAYVHPALVEGFGLPMLEAMRAGTPVIASETSIPGVLRPYARTFAPGDAGTLSQLLTAVLDPGAASVEDRAAAREAARRLTWERCVAQTVDVYRELLN